MEVLSLSSAMVKVFLAPALSFAVERDHNTGKAVINKHRSRLHELGYQVQVSGSFKLKQKLNSNLGSCFNKHV